MRTEALDHLEEDDTWSPGSDTDGAPAPADRPLARAPNRPVFPFAAIVAPIAAAMLTWYACEFLVSGFAARGIDDGQVAG